MTTFAGFRALLTALAMSIATTAVAPDPASGAPVLTISGAISETNSDASAEYQSELIYARSIWQLNRMEVLP